MAQTDYRIAALSGDQLRAIEELEHRLGLTLIAWERADGERRAPVAAAAPQARLTGESLL